MTEEQKESIRKALGDVWRTAELGRSTTVKMPGDENIERQRQLWRELGEALLGEQMNCEIKT